MLFSAAKRQMFQPFSQFTERPAENCFSSENPVVSPPFAIPSTLGVSMLRQRLNDDLKAAMKSRDQRATSTLRLILAALKDRDIAARERGITNGVDEPEIIDLLQKMVRQRQESITLYQKGGRQELADQEQGEIDIIERYLPK